MKVKNIRFLAKSNIKGNKKSNTIIVLTVMLVISLTLISSFSVTVTNAVNIQKEDFRTRALEVGPFYKPLTDDVVENIKEIDHVEDVAIVQGMWNGFFNVLNISDENGTYDEVQQKIDSDGATVLAWSLIGDERKSVIAGKTLDEAPAFSCIIPSLFYPYKNNYENGKELNNLDYIDGTSLVGKTITVKAIDVRGDGFDIVYNYEAGEGSISSEFEQLPLFEYKLKIAGVYYASPNEFGYYNNIFISKETGTLIYEQALEAGGYLKLTNEESAVTKWWNTPSLHNHYVIVDDYANIEFVNNALVDKGLYGGGSPNREIKSSTLTIASILSVAGSILIAAVTILCIINLIQSTSSSLRNRREELGLLKAIGYTDRQIFACLCYEQLALTVKGFIIGGGISAVFITVSNLINSHTTFANRLYIVDWSYCLLFLAISLAIAIIVPLICQLIALHKLKKIQPREAMG